MGTMIQPNENSDNPCGSTVMTGSVAATTHTRPSISNEIKEKAAFITAKEAPNIDKDAVADLAKSIFENYTLHDDGYELAKKLERDGWNVDTMFVEAMDYMDMQVWEIHRQKCVSWVSDNNIKPPLPVGAKLDCGEITGISKHNPASYEVKKYGQDDSETGHCRRIIRYEDAVLAEVN